MINNADLFGPLANDSVVIVVQVHDRLEYLRFVVGIQFQSLIQVSLRQLIKSFSLTAGIDKVLIIFSHDVWSEDLNSLIRFIYITILQL